MTKLTAKGWCWIWFVGTITQAAGQPSPQGSEGPARRRVLPQRPTVGYTRTQAVEKGPDYRAFLREGLKTGLRRPWLRVLGFLSLGLETTMNSHCRP